MADITETLKSRIQNKIAAAKPDEPVFTKDEIKEILIEAGSQGNQSDVDLAFDIYNNAKSKTLYHDFIIFVQQVVRADSRNTLRELFESLDANHDGVLQFDEVLNGFHELGISITPEEVSALFKEADENGDQVLQFDEFVHVVSKYQ